jgi:hypothetical protein
MQLLRLGFIKKLTITPASPRRAKTRPFPKQAAGSEACEAYPLWYVERGSRLRTPLEDFFTSPCV